MSTDGKTAWMVATAGHSILRIDLENNRVSASTLLPLAPDNLSWAPDGRLLVTGAVDLRRLVNCASHEPPCAVPFAVAVVEPTSPATRIVYRNAGR